MRSGTDRRPLERIGARMGGLVLTGSEYIGDRLQIRPARWDGLNRVSSLDHPSGLNHSDQ